MITTFRLSATTLFGISFAAFVSLWLSDAALAGDYVQDRQAASALAKQGTYAEALTAFTAMAEGELTDFQRSDALEQAAACARRLDKFDLAAELARRIPLDAVAKTAQMQNLLAMRKPQELVDEFKDENIDAWPFWKAGEAFYARGRAFCDTGAGKAAESDLTKAIELATDELAQADVLLELGQNREDNLKDTAGALEAYRRIAGMPKHHNNSTYFRGILGAARLLRSVGEFTESEATIRKVDLPHLSGFWHGAIHLALAETLTAAGRKDEALTVYRQLVEDDTVQQIHRSAAQKVLDAPEPRAD